MQKRQLALGHWKASALTMTIIGVLAMTTVNLTPVGAAAPYNRGEGYHITPRGTTAPAYPGEPITTSPYTYEGCARYDSGTFRLAFPGFGNTPKPVVATVAFTPVNALHWFEGPSGTFNAGVPGEVKSSGSPTGCLRSAAGASPVAIEFTSVTFAGDTVCSKPAGTQTGTIKRGAPITYFSSGVVAPLPLDSVYTISGIPCGAGTYTLTAHVAAHNVNSTTAVTPPCAPPIISIACTLHQGTLS